MLPRVASLIRMQPPLTVNRGLLSGSGATVPVDGTDGWQTGAIFQHTDGGNGTALYINEGSVTSSAFKAVESGSYGSQANTAGSGIAISSTITGALKVFSDDAGSNIAASVRGIQSRFLLTTDASGSSIRALQGQLKILTGVDVTTGIYTAVQGYVELAGTHSVQTSATFSCFDASLEIGTALTVDSGGEACGLHVETTGSGTITNNGTCAGILIDKASGAADWPLGLYILGSDVIEGIRVGTFHSTTAGSGVPVATAVTAANRFYTDDGGAAIVNTGVNDTRGVLSRLLVTTDHSANELRLFALEGQLKSRNAEWDNEMVAAVYGYLELERTGGTLTLDGYGFTAGVMSCVENSGAYTIGTNHVLSGFCAVSKITSDATVTGKSAAFHAGIYDGTNWSSSAEDEQPWEYGLLIQDGAATTGIEIGTCTTGLTIGVCTTAISVLDVILITPGAAGTLLDFDLNATYVSGSTIVANFSASTTLSSAVVGISLDFGTNIVVTSEQNVTGFSITLPASTNDAASPALRGLVVAVSGAMTTASSGAATYRGVEVTCPAITQSAGTCVAHGVYLTAGTITTGTMTGIELSGTWTNGIVISACTTGLSIASCTTAISVLDKILSTPDAAGTLLDFDLNATWTSGGVIVADFSASTTLLSSVVGISLDLGSNIVATSEQSVTGYSVTLPASTNNAASPNLVGVLVAVTGAMTTAASGTATFRGVQIATPAITQTAGSCLSHGIYISGGAITTGTAVGIELAGAWSTGIVFGGTTTLTGINFGFTLTPNSAISYHSFVIGSRGAVETVTFASGVGVESLEPIQMNFDLVGSNPDNTSTVNIWQGAITHTTNDLLAVRLKWTDLLTTVNKTCRDVYVHQAEIALGAATYTIASEVAVLGLVCDAGSGAITCGTYNGVNITMRGAGTPANAAGLFIHGTSNCTLGAGIRIFGSPLPSVGIAFGSYSNDNQAPAAAFSFPTGPSADVGPVRHTADASGDVEGSILIKIGGVSKYLHYWPNETS